MVDRELLLRDQGIEVEAERAHVLRQLFRTLLEGDEDARLVELGGAAHQELDREQRLAATRSPANERRPALGQPATGDLIEAVDSRRRLRQRASLRWAPHPHRRAWMVAHVGSLTSPHSRCRRPTAGAFYGRETTRASLSACSAPSRTGLSFTFESREKKSNDSPMTSAPCRRYFQSSGF